MGFETISLAMTELCFAVTHAEVFKKEAACGSDLLRHQFSCLQGYGGSEPLRQQFSSQACGVQRQLSSPGSFQCGRTPMGSQVDSGLFVNGLYKAIINVIMATSSLTL